MYKNHFTRKVFSRCKSAEENRLIVLIEKKNTEICHCDDQTETHPFTRGIISIACSCLNRSFSSSELHFQVGWNWKSSSVFLQHPRICSGNSFNHKSHRGWMSPTLIPCKINYCTKKKLFDLCNTREILGSIVYKHQWRISPDLTDLTFWWSVGQMHAGFYCASGREEVNSSTASGSW